MTFIASVKAHAVSVKLKHTLWTAHEELHSSSVVLVEIKTDDGVMITVHNSGPALPATSAGLAHTTLRFTAPTGQHDWLNKANFVGTLKAEMADGYVLVRVDQVL